MGLNLLSNLNETLLTIPNGTVIFSHPMISDIGVIINILKNEDLDIRRIDNISEQGYQIENVENLANLWLEEINNFTNQYPDDISTQKQIRKQSNGLVKLIPQPNEGTFIVDPFNMKSVEQNINIQLLASQQLQNTIVGKLNNQIVTIGRLLEVEGSVELVSLWTDPVNRRLGLAKKVIELLINHALEFPIYSFQKPSLIHYYQTEYRKYKSAEILPFDQLPKPLQRDLYYMNTFWGPYTIIRINL